MVNIIDRRDIRNLNLFSKITRIPTRYCFEYNNAVIFAVPKKLVRRAVGENASNVKRLSELLRKRVKVVAIPESVDDAKVLIEAVISPVTFKDIEITDDEIVVTGGAQNKAALIGRNKRRLLEMQEIVRDFFKREFRIA